MEIQDYLDEIKNIQRNIQYFLDNEEIEEEIFLTLTNIFNDTNVYNNKYKLKLVLHLIAEISNNYHRFGNFFPKIEKILLIFKEKIIFFYPNWEIFNIFKSNKRILLFLIIEKMLVVDEYVIKTLNTSKYLLENYHLYFAPEIKPYINSTNCLNYELITHFSDNLPQNFNEKRKMGENDSFICGIIRNDLINEFIKLKSENLNNIIEPSIFETHNLLLNKKTTLIEYAAFFGSIKIFKYLIKNEIELTPSLWIYAIHSNKFEIINIIEENNIKPINGSDKKCIEESLKCHHCDIFLYFMSNYCDSLNLINILPFSLKYYNFDFIENEFINVFTFTALCKFDYYIFVDLLLKNNDININEEIN